MNKHAWIMMMAAGVALAGGAWAITIGDFNPTPELPYEATSFHHDDLFKIANGPLQGDRVESEVMRVCTELAEDPEAPAALRRWAALRKVEVLCYISREDESVRQAREWLEKHPEDPDPISIRAIIARTLAERRSDNFKPTRREVQDAFRELFEKHAADALDWRMIEARVWFGTFLDREANINPSESTPLSLQSVLEFQEALRAVQSRMALPGCAEEEKKGCEEYIKHNINPFLYPSRETLPGPSEEAKAKMRESTLNMLMKQGLDRAAAESFLDQFDGGQTTAP
ncbi:MAG TPA: hypothetical protein PKL54_03200 [Candidatus Hydrogenedentes bacterium]|nr:hypothetical protein [Candidatus Hydrogenedentota bacterium]HQL94468.1 hypothetical protein [Candidatus Hydrogenedentota bacterium]